MTDLDEIRRKRLMAALLQGLSHEAACDEVGISTSTGWRIRRDESFAEQLREENQRIYDDNMARLYGLSELAYHGLVESLKSENPHIRLKATTAYYTLMSNPKTLFNDQDVQGMREALSSFKAAIAHLDPDTKQAVKTAMEYVSRDRNKGA